MSSLVIAEVDDHTPATQEDVTVSIKALAEVVKRTILRGKVYQPDILAEAFSNHEVNKLLFKGHANKPYGRQKGSPDVHNVDIVYLGNQSPSSPVPYFITQIGTYDNPVRITKPISGHIGDPIKSKAIENGGKPADLDKMCSLEYGDGPNAINYDIGTSVILSYTSHPDAFHLARTMDGVSLYVWSAGKSYHGMSDETALENLNTSFSNRQKGIRPEIVDPFGNAPYLATAYLRIRANFYTPDIPVVGRKSNRRAAFCTTVVRRVKNEDGTFTDTPGTFRDLLNKQAFVPGDPPYSLCVIVEGAWTKVETGAVPYFGSYFEASRFIIVDNVPEQSVSGNLGEVEDSALVSQRMKRDMQALFSGRNGPQQHTIGAAPHKQLAIAEVASSSDFDDNVASRQKREASDPEDLAPAAKIEKTED